ncbi:hypothetical protein [Rhizobium herbae]|uniref:Uncharacterized protein n=1 Tax=Rhizobium herbae TaxID=508661 RepID=A0ABS4EJR9_9HYPH|nr:hypothetical protein [Rhizobium herbae]MBP1858195.1 hypothetical protein [Rhizobium herbae]
MKKRFEDWAKLSSNSDAVVKKTPHTPIKFVEISDFQKLEDKLLLYRSLYGELPPELGNFIDDLSRKTFGVTEENTRFQFPEEYQDLPEWDSERWAIDSSFYRHELQFETADVTDDEAVKVLLNLGLDFRDTRGWPLQSTKYFCRQAEAAAKKIMGRMPDRSAVQFESWAKALERDAARYMARKKPI